jgi:hypothetical protein
MKSKLLASFPIAGSVEGTRREGKREKCSVRREGGGTDHAPRVTLRKN